MPVAPMMLMTFLDMVRLKLLSIGVKKDCGLR